MLKMYLKHFFNIAREREINSLIIAEMMHNKKHSYGNLKDTLIIFAKVLQMFNKRSFYRSKWYLNLLYLLFPVDLLFRSLERLIEGKVVQLYLSVTVGNWESQFLQVMWLSHLRLARERLMRTQCGGNPL